MVIVYKSNEKSLNRKLPEQQWITMSPEPVVAEGEGAIVMSGGEIGGSGISSKVGGGGGGRLGIPPVSLEPPPKPPLEYPPRP